MLKKYKQITEKVNEKIADPNIGLINQPAVDEIKQLIDNMINKYYMFHSLYSSKN